MAGCATCGKPLAPNKAPGRPRKYCDDRCRKRKYDLVCIDCGARVDGTTPSKMANRDEPRCYACSVTHDKATGLRKTWDRARILNAIREWARLYGEQPGIADWNTGQLQALGNQERLARSRAARAAGIAPTHGTVIREFGSWNAAIEAAGFTPRAPHGGGGNHLRRRNARSGAA
jgi:hypothetical protein